MLLKNRFTIENGILTVILSRKGGEPISIQKDGHEYLWHRDPEYWESSAPLLFPAVGRLRGGEWTHEGETYQMGIHGFARFQRMRPYVMNDFAEFSMTDNEETRKSYPFSFSLYRRFKLSQNALIETVTVKNTDSKDISFGIGLHPGFMLPEGHARLKLDCHKEPRRHFLSPRFFMADESEPYPLREDRYIDLDNSLFDNDAIILSGVEAVTLESPDSERSVTVYSRNANYIGFWQPMHSDAPFLCIEPWQSLPASDAPEGAPPDEISERRGFVKLQPGKSYNFECVYIFN